MSISYTLKFSRWINFRVFRESVCIRENKNRENFTGNFTPKLSLAWERDRRSYTRVCVCSAAQVLNEQLAIYASLHDEKGQW